MIAAATATVATTFIVATTTTVIVVVTDHPMGALIGQEDIREFDDEPIKLKILCHCRCELSSRV